MNVKDDIQKTIRILKKQRKFKSQADIAESLGYNPSYFSRVISSGEIPMDLEDAFFKAFPRSVYLAHEKKYEALEQLKKVQNGKKPIEGKVVPDSDIVKIKTYTIPIKGFSGLKKALFADEYISTHFDMEYTEVPREYYAPTSFRIQSVGHSMPDTIPENAWVTGVPIPEQDWLDYKFRSDKIYVLFHPYKGILFKKVKRTGFSSVTLCSENSDKVEYPDETFEITEFRKILIAIKVERFI